MATVCNVLVRIASRLSDIELGVELAAKIDEFGASLSVEDQAVLAIFFQMMMMSVASARGSDGQAWSTWCPLGQRC